MNTTTAEFIRAIAQHRLNFILSYADITIKDMPNASVYYHGLQPDINDNCKILLMDKESMTRLVMHVDDILINGSSYQLLDQITCRGVLRSQKINK